MLKLGVFLFRYRGVIALPFFILLFICSGPGTNVIIAFILIISGLCLRIWAAGYLGVRGRKKVFVADYVIINGPFKYLKHPLYIGNFLLVFGVNVLYNPPIWLIFIIFSLFIAIYSIFIYCEIQYLKPMPRLRAIFYWSNLKGEISTVFIMLIIVLLYVLRHTLRLFR